MSQATKNLAMLVAGLAAAFAVLSRRSLAAEPPLSLTAVRNFAANIVSAFRFNVDPQMMVRIAWIESNFNPSAVRYEPHIGDASSGLMQTLLSTARWLATDMGYRAFGVPDMARLLEPQASLYFGGAYLDYLSRYKGQSRSEEWIVRSYNGGPGHSDAATDAYWKKYLRAKQELG